jgi:alkaline phosphatase D
MRFLFLCCLNLFGYVAFCQPLFDTLLNNLRNPALKPFYFGVASGDPHQEDVIIWTKVWNDNSEPVKVTWEVATDTAMQQVVRAADVTTTSASAYTVKVLVKGLQPNTTYFYRFTSGGLTSPIGRTITAPVNADDLRFAVVSCNHYEGGYFNAYRLIAERTDINAVIHLGDYIYEYGASKINKKSVIRQHIPTHEIITLQDYRSRYAQYRMDSDLQEAHRLHPFITEWDDHEFANDTYKEGAKNHQSNEGDWEARKAIAKKAYFEWMPIADNDKESVIRKISYGNMADIFMLDGRVEGRCKQLDSPQDTLLSCTTRTMLGKEQTDWLIDGIDNSQAHWKIMANQVVFSELDAHQLSKKYAINADAWDGYPVERKVILDSFYARGTKNIIIITGDIHLSWGFDLVQDPKNKDRYNRLTGKGVIGAEFVTPSISTNGIGERFPRGLSNLIGAIIKKNATNPHLRFQNLVDHGFLILDLNNDRAKSTWVFCKTIRKKSDKFSDYNSFITRYNDNHLVRETLLNKKQ